MQTNLINMDKKPLAPPLRAACHVGAPARRPGAAANPGDRSGRLIGFDRETSLDGTRLRDLT